MLRTFYFFRFFQKFPARPCWPFSHAYANGATTRHQADLKAKESLFVIRLSSLLLLSAKPAVQIMDIAKDSRVQVDPDGDAVDAGEQGGQVQLQVATLEARRLLPAKVGVERGCVRLDKSHGNTGAV